LCSNPLDKQQTDVQVDRQQLSSFSYSQTAADLSTTCSSNIVVVGHKLANQPSIQRRIIHRFSSRQQSILQNHEEAVTVKL
jgi:hypothetical protein